MDKQIITFTANEQCLRKTGGLEVFATKTVSYIEAHFDLGTNWSGYDSVRAVWWNDYVRPISTVLDSDGVCIVPTEVLLRKGAVYVNLVGSIAEGDVLTDRLTTIPITALVEKFNAHVDSTETAPITPSQFEQFVEAVKADADRAEDAKDDARGYASDAQTYAENASTSATNASTSEDNAKESELNAEAYKNQAQTYAQNAYNSSVSAESAKDDAILARDEIRNMSAEATTLPAGSDATASYSDGVLSLGIPKGVKGDRGQQGIQGETGATPNLTIGTVETLEPTEDATATITGTAENPVLNLGIPQGEVGEVSYADLKTLLPMDTASGAIVSITDGQPIIPVDSLKVSLEPIQDLNGYDKPWVGGAGKNLFDSSVFPPTVSQTIVYVHYEVQNGTYTMSTPDFPLVNGITNVYFLAGAVSSGASSGSNGVSQSTPITITVTDGHYTVAYRSNNDVNTNNPKNFKWQIEVGNSATTYSPYSNICPISGRTECVTSRAGKNLLRLPTYEEVIAVTDIVTSYYSIPIKVKPSTNYYLQTEFINGYTAVGKGQYVLISNDPNGNSPWVAIAHNTADGGKLDGAIMSTSEGHLYLRVMRSMLNKPAWDTLLENVETMLAEGTTATAYEPYNGNTYTTTLGRTVYGGTLDVVSGELVVDRAMASYDGSETWSLNSTGGITRFSTISKLADAKKEVGYRTPMISDSLVYAPSGNAVGSGFIYGTQSSAQLFVIADQSITTVDAFKAWLADNPITICYELATPTTAQLTPQEVKLLLGNNTIWSDGDVAIVYSADVTKWIEKQLS